MKSSRRITSQDKNSEEKKQDNGDGFEGESVDEAFLDENVNLLDDDLYLSDKEESDFVEYESLLQSPHPCRLIFKKKVVPIARKTDYDAGPHQSDGSNDENEPPNANLVASRDNVVQKQNDNSVSHLNKKSVNINSKKTKDVQLEKRNMFIPITQVELDSYNLDFLKGDEENIRKKISGMCHSLRFWLAAKFSGSLTRTKGLAKSGTMTIVKICRLLGIDNNSFRKFFSKPENQSKVPSDFDGYSPLEFHNLKKCAHPKIIESLALNLNSSLVQNVISAKK